jgi:hypothetical protein
MKLTVSFLIWLLSIVFLGYSIKEELLKSSISSLKSTE